ncbi:Uncharacterised protein [Raoultella ornithinolytica]|nr:Uncharacterised protein [Raoultella ornithinolytica]
MFGVSFVSQHCMAMTLHAAVLVLYTNTVQKTLCKLAFVSLTGTQYDI